MQTHLEAVAQWYWRAVADAGNTESGAVHSKPSFKD